MGSRSDNPIAMVPSSSKAVKRREKAEKKKRQMQKPRSLGNRRWVFSFVCFFWGGVCVSATAILDKMNIQRVFQAKIAKEGTGLCR